MTAIDLGPLDPEDIEWILRWYEGFPKYPTGTESRLVERLKAALPAPVVAVELTAAQLDQLGSWFAYAQNEGGASLHDPRDAELIALLDAARKSL